MMTARYLIGVDEAGRGPLAGPLAVAAVALSHHVQHLVFNKLATGLSEKLPLRDSKKLTALQRERWFRRLRGMRETGDLVFAVALVGPRVIDAAGISAATRLGVRRALSKLALDAPRCSVLLDGLLRAPRQFADQRTLVRGDETEPLIALASIVAKVTRDRFMVRMSRRYPDYGFERHKGYGTAAHYAALEQSGPSPMHRASFLLRARHVS